jgi:hypothetical protein
MAEIGKSALMAQAMIRVRNDKVWTSNLTVTWTPYAARKVAAIAMRSQTRDVACRIMKKGRINRP